MGQDKDTIHKRGKEEGKMSEDKKNEFEKVIENALAIAKEHIQIQLISKRTLDGKIGILMGFIGVIFVLSWDLFPDLNYHLFYLATGYLSFSFIITIVGYRAKEWVFPPNLETLSKMIYDEGLNRQEVNEQFLANVTEAWIANKKQAQYLSKLFNIALIFLVSGLFVLFLSRSLGH